jgi:hypothetical protein
MKTFGLLVWALLLGLLSACSGDTVQPEPPSPLPAPPQSPPRVSPLPAPPQSPPRVSPPPRPAKVLIPEQRHSQRTEHSGRFRLRTVSAQIGTRGLVASDALERGQLGINYADLEWLEQRPYADAEAVAFLQGDRPQ